MSKKTDTASALAGILSAKRGEELPTEPAGPVAVSRAVETPPPPSPAPMAPTVSNLPASPRKVRGGKSSDKANYSQFSIYLRRDTRKKVGRALDDADMGQDFSELVQELLEQWLNART